MLARIFSQVRTRWHPLWRLRQSSLYRRFQRHCDFPVNTRIPGTDLRVAVNLLRDASWIFSPGNLEPQIRAAFTLVLDLVKPTVFWDAGANIGFYSWFVRRHASVRQVVMFEPDPTNFSLLQRTIRQNAITDCQAINVALSDGAGEASFLVDRASGATGSLEALSLREDERTLQHAYQMNETINCRTATVDGLIAEGVPAPQFLKIDVESAEHLVLAGAAGCLAEHRPAMMIETSNAEVTRKLVDLGYQAFRIDGGNLLFVSPRDGLDLTPLQRAFPDGDLAAQP